MVCTEILFGVGYDIKWQLTKYDLEAFILYSTVMTVISGEGEG